MSNGVDRSWIRFCGTVDGFRSRYGSWPTRVKAYPDIVSDLKNILSDQNYAILLQSLEVIAADEPLVAQDDEGRKYSYGSEGFSK